MKKLLFLITILFCFYFSNAQIHKIATAVKGKKFATVAHSATQKGSPACDTLKLDSAINLWTPFYYTYGKNGFVFGVADKDSLEASIDEDANYYDVSGTDYTYITGGLALFAFANSSNPSHLNKNMIFKVYDDLNGFPNNLLGSTSVKLSSIKTDVDNGLVTEFTFTTPIAVPANKIFYISVDHSNFNWSKNSRDSVALYASGNNEAPASAYLYATPNPPFGWYQSANVWSANAQGDPLNADLFIFPYVNNSIDGCSVLPVSMTNFKGIINNNNQPYLTWTTVNEVNNKGFEIERSKDGKTFTSIGFISGAGNSKKINNYSFADITLNDLSASINYYRLKQIDVDGKATYSNVIPLSLKNILSWKLYPNPIKDKLTIELNLTADSKVNVQVISKDGRTVLNADKGTLPQGVQELSFNINNIPAGSYFVRIKAGDKYYTQTIVKQ